QCSLLHCVLLSFPTRRSSDLQPSFGQFQLAQLLPIYAQSFPDVLLDITLTDRNTDLVEEGIDVGIFLGTSDKFDASMITRQLGVDRKSTRLNSSHSQISYAVF